MDMLYRIENDSQLWAVSATNVPYSRYTLHNFISTSTGDIYADRQVRLIIENNKGEAVGLADLVSFDPKHLRAEIGIVIERPYCGMGYGLEVVSALHHYAKHTLHLHQIYAVISVDNEAAIRMFNKAGYVKGCLLKQWLYDGKDYQDAVLFQMFL